MKFKIQLVMVSEDDQPETVKELAVLNKDSQRIEHLGLTLAESKAILKQLQANLVNEQVASYLDTRRSCPDCGTPLRTKGSQPITFRTLFGHIGLDSPRLRHCRCGPRATDTFSPLTTLLPEHTAPELLFVETK